MPAFRRKRAPVGAISKSVLFALSLLVANLVVAADWQLQTERDDIRLYTRPASNSPLKSFKVVTRVQASLSSLVAFLNDQQAYPEWMDKIAEVDTLKNMKDKAFVHRQVVDTPWPEPDQDNILYSSWSQDSDTLVMTKKVISMPTYMQPVADIRRQKAYEAQWQLIPQTNGWVEVVYSAEIDPGMARVYPWMEKLLTEQMPFTTMQNFKRMNFGSYQGKSFAFVKEPTLTGNLSVTH